MGGQPDPWTIPPTELQLDAMCREAATIARSWGWREADVTISRVMTHAEAASNRDGIWMHDNYGPVIWGGSGERWDFLQLSKGGPPTGGDELRARIRRFLAEPDATTRLAFRRATSISARGQELAVELDDNGSSWALSADLLARYEIPYEWDANRRRILIVSLDVVPSFREDQVQPTVGWPLFEIILQSGNAPVIWSLRPSIRWKSASPLSITASEPSYRL
jgi:hypothetical protein